MAQDRMSRCVACNRRVGSGEIADSIKETEPLEKEAFGDSFETTLCSDCLPAYKALIPRVAEYQRHAKHK